MTTDEHKACHVRLHKQLDELVADWITHVPKASINRPLIDFMQWSHEQTIEPTEET